jgi:LysM repeat protein
MALASSGCGYVVVQVTAPPPTVTPTVPVELTLSRPRSTATPVPATPLPTATPTATPTPIVHVVQKGDNLLAIAFQYEVDLQALIAANEIPDPRALRIGQELIIPRQDVDVDPQVTATPTPMPLKIVHVAFHHTPAGSAWCMGEVQNERDEFLDTVQLRLSLYSLDGELIETLTSFVTTDIVPGHGRAPFLVLIPPSLAGRFASHELEVISAEPITHWGRRHRALTVRGIALQDGQGILSADGEVCNPGQEDAQEVRLTVVTHGEQGLVVGVRQMDVVRLAAGECQPFSLPLVPAAPPVEVEGVAWGMKALP